MSIFGDTILNFAVFTVSVLYRFSETGAVNAESFPELLPRITLPKQNECTHGNPECLLPACTCAVTNLDNPAQRETSRLAQWEYLYAAILTKRAIKNTIFIYKYQSRSLGMVFAII